MFSKIVLTVSAGVFGAALLLGASASASSVSFDDIEIRTSNFLQSLSGTFVTAAGTNGALELVDFQPYVAVNDDINQGSVSSTGATVSDPMLTGMLVTTLSTTDPIKFPPFATYVAGNLIESRQTTATVMEGLFLRTDTSNADFGDYLVIRFTSSDDFIESGTNFAQSIQVFGADRISGIPLPASIVFLFSGVAGLTAVRKFKVVS